MPHWSPQGASVPGRARGNSVVSSLSKAVVEVSEGKLLGFIDRGIYTFRGIPYAQARRFMMPQRVNPWSGIRDATRYGEICYQSPVRNRVARDEFFNPHVYLEQSEHCQFLNIWTPGLADGKKRPVMVYLHGGAFSAGSSLSPLTDGRNLSEKGDVVVVSLNHRLNVLGFLDLSLCGEAYRHSANVGIADIVAALEWIRENIEQFGGDPENVTLFGNSGGGAKILALAATPAARGLFHKAVIQSGIAFGFGMTLNEKEAAERVAALTLKNLNLSPKDVDKLQEVPYHVLLEAANSAKRQVSQELNIRYMWGPVLDGTYIPTHPVAEEFAPQARDIPMIMGTVLNEFTTIITSEAVDLLCDNKDTWSMEKVLAKLTEKYGSRAQDALHAFMKAYPNKKPADAYFVDTAFRPATLEAARKKAAQKGAPVYTYVFAYEAPVMDGVGMAWHCAELPYVFDNTDLVPTATGGGIAAKVVAHMVSLAWIHFAYTGDPTHEWIPKWPPFTPSEGATMVIDTLWEVRYHHDKDLMDLAVELGLTELPDFDF
ncbi:carboxylesterase/lipase family protein [Candidatus Caldatribacterium sp. SIUC1]|uniref:carboxylesterase/lipase family protein n=1 Tax=Candidatus Caldatribacterium sp. SIUC1 TaxID=3418365 RepID=UPI003F68E325